MLLTDRGWLVVFLYFLEEWWIDDGGGDKRLSCFKILVVPSRCIFCWGDPYFILPVFSGNLLSGFQGSDLELAEAPKHNAALKSDIVLPGPENLQQTDCFWLQGYPPPPPKKQYSFCGGRRGMLCHAFKTYG